MVIGKREMKNRLSITRVVGCSLAGAVGDALPIVKVAPGTKSIVVPRLVRKFG